MVFVHRLVLNKPQPFPERCAHVWFGAVIKQQAGEGFVPPQTDAIRLRYHTSKQRRVSAKTVGVDLSLCVHIGPTLQQPARDLDLVVIDTHVQEGRACEWRPVQREGMIGVTA